MDNPSVAPAPTAAPSPPPAAYVPRGAIAFFLAVMAGFALIWAGLYLLLLHRQ